MKYFWLKPGRSGSASSRASSCNNKVTKMLLVVMVSSKQLTHTHVHTAQPAMKRSGRTTQWHSDALHTLSHLSWQRLRHGCEYLQRDGMVPRVAAAAGEASTAAVMQLRCVNTHVPKYFGQ